MDALILSRIQFALTIGFHFLFPPISIGLAWLLVIAEFKAWRTNDPEWTALGKFFSKILALTFVVGVATGIVMEFQFGTNWSEYSKFVGDVFGAPLAAEGVIAFFLESGFLGVYLFARDRISKGWHWFSILMVAVGATISAFWIIVANSWQQTPGYMDASGQYVLSGAAIEHGRAVMKDFAKIVFNSSTLATLLPHIDRNAGRRVILHGRPRGLSAAKEQPRRRRPQGHETRRIRRPARRPSSSPSPPATSTPSRSLATSPRSSPPSKGSIRPPTATRRWCSSPIR